VRSTDERPARPYGWAGSFRDYMPELNVLCGIADFSTESEQHDAG